MTPAKKSPQQAVIRKSRVGIMLAVGKKE